MLEFFNNMDKMMADQDQVKEMEILERDANG